MDDTEAEAALLALGPQLEWEVSPGGDRLQEETVVARLPDKYYFAFKLGKFWGDCHSDAPYIAEVQYPPVANTGNETLPDTYVSLAAAKAACERHHATGKWE